jgi:hypothetical protein
MHSCSFIVYIYAFSSRASTLFIAYAFMPFHHVHPCLLSHIHAFHRVHPHLSSCASTPFPRVYPCFFIMCIHALHLTNLPCLHNPYLYTSHSAHLTCHTFPPLHLINMPYLPTLPTFSLHLILCPVHHHITCTNLSSCSSMLPLPNAPCISYPYVPRILYPHMPHVSYLYPMHRASHTHMRLAHRTHMCLTCLTFT